MTARKGAFFRRALIILSARAAKTIFILASVIFRSTQVMAQSPVSLLINTESPGLAIRPDFGVFSFETGSLEYGNANYTTNG